MRKERRIGPKSGNRAYLILRIPSEKVNHDRSPIASAFFNSLLDAQALLHPLHRLGWRIIIRHQPVQRLL
jgi:hypothetical protein